MANDLLSFGGGGIVSPVQCSPLVYAFKTQVYPNFAAGEYYVTPPYGNPPMVGTPQYREAVIGFPGVMSGVSTKRFYFQQRLISVVLAILDVNKQNVNTAWETIAQALTSQKRYSVTMPGGQVYTNCKCMTAGMGERWVTLGPSCIAYVVGITIMQLSTGTQL